MLSKIFWDVAAPGNVLVLILLASLVLGRSRPLAARRLAALATLGLVLCGWSATSLWLAAPLEDRFPANPALPERLDGIIVLGGSLNPRLSASLGRPAVTQSSDRLTSAVVLAREFPAARVVVTGGSADPWNQEAREAPWSARFLTEMGVDPGRLVIEPDSRNTYENALYTKRLIDPKPNERWLLVTSAIHMPRAIGCFRGVGWSVIPYPVDFRVARDERWGFDLPLNLLMLSSTAKEWVGLVAYRLLDRTTALLPGP